MAFTEAFIPRPPKGTEVKEYINQYVSETDFDGVEDVHITVLSEGGIEVVTVYRELYNSKGRLSAG